jgi:hypothetical protein
MDMVTKVPLLSRRALLEEETAVAVAVPSWTLELPAAARSPAYTGWGWFSLCRTHPTPFLSSMPVSCTHGDPPCHKSIIITA